MGKRKNLNGLPNNLVQSYLSSLNYYDRGYVADWIWKRASEKKITELEIDILNQIVTPNSMESKAIFNYLDKLNETIHRTLEVNGFESNFITSAKFTVLIGKMDAALNQISIQCSLEDIDKKYYESKVYQQSVFPVADSLFEKIMKKVFK